MDTQEVKGEGVQMDTQEVGRKVWEKLKLA